MCSSSALLACQDVHAGPVTCIDVSPHQANLIASASVQEDFRVLDLKDPTAPASFKPSKVTHGTTSTITSVAWNFDSMNILGTSMDTGTCQVWDLRQQKVVIEFADSGHRNTRISKLAWHPLSTTLALTAADDDAAPALRLWDLRNNNFPVKTLPLQGAGLTDVMWCPDDVELAITTCRDTRTLFWDVEGGTIVSEAPRSRFAATSVSWAARDVHGPGVFGVGSLTGSVIDMYRSEDLRFSSAETASLQQEQPLQQSQGFGSMASVGGAGTCQLVDNVTTPTTVVITPNRCVYCLW